MKTEMAQNGRNPHSADFILSENKGNSDFMTDCDIIWELRMWKIEISLKSAAEVISLTSWCSVTRSRV
jgi:hypothetical protein